MTKDRMGIDPTFHIRPFAFDRVFAAIDTPVAQAGAADLRLRVAALEADLALAAVAANETRDEGYAAGIEAGRAEAQAGHEAALLVAVDALHAAVEEVEAGLEHAARSAIADAATLAQAAAEHLAARALADAPAAAIDAAIGRVLGEVSRGQEIQVAVAPALEHDIAALIERRQAGDRRRLALTVAADATLAPGDAHIRWDHGGVILDRASRHAAVAAAFDQLAIAAPRD